jgi:hypothetical protein
LFIGFASLVIIGILIMLFGMGPFVRNKKLEELVENKTVSTAG